MEMPGLPDAAAIARRAWVAGIKAPPQRSVAEWADAERKLGPEEGRYPGDWRTDRTPYLRDPMNCMGLSHPSRRVTLLSSAQSAKTMAALNAVGQMIVETPTTILWACPSDDEAKKFNREKLEPLISNSPTVRRRVRALVSRDENSSTTRLKLFPGGLLSLTGATSSKGLQMVTRRVVVLDEVTEFPQTIEGRGDPVGMAEARTIQHIGEEKIIAISTPGVKGACRITARWEEGSRGRFCVPCPHCQHRQPLEMANLRWPEGRPEEALYHCSACGAGIEHRHKASMLAAGEWVHERPDLLGYHPSFRLNALYPLWVPWSAVAAKREETRDDPEQDKVFCQQWAAEAYEQRFDLPSHDLLFRRREPWPARRIPPGVLFLVLSVDVQGDRLEWACYGFDRHFGQWWIDGGILMGDPGLDPVWLELDQVLAMDWPDAWGRRWKAQSLGLDAGYLPQRCYAYARRHAGHPRPKVFALDGRPKWGLAPIGTPSVQDVDFLGKKIGAVQLWPVGTWDLKTELSAALRLTEMGPDTTGAWPRGAMRFPQVVSQEFFQQLTAEACVTIETRQGYERREWRKIAQRNEQWDLAVYARALARHYTANWTEARWQNLIAERSGPGAAVQGDLLDLAAAPEAADAALAAARQAALAEAEAAAARAEVQRVQQAAARQAARRPPPTTWGHAPTWGASGW